MVADGSWFDSDKGTPATGNQPSIDVEGELAGLDYNRGWANADGTVYYQNPVLEAGLQLRAALRADGIKLAGGLPVSTGTTPAAATTLTSVSSPTIAKLIELTNTPSDNFFAETLLKDLGAKFGAGGTTADGAAVVRTHVASAFGVDPRFDDGSGLSRYDRTTPAQVISLLRTMAEQRRVHELAGDRGRNRHARRRDERHVRAGSLPRQDRHAARRLQCGRLLHRARRRHDRVRTADERRRARRRTPDPGPDAGRDRPLRRLSARSPSSSASSPASSITATPSFSALASLVPALSPATT